MPGGRKLKLKFLTIVPGVQNCGPKLGKVSGAVPEGSQYTSVN